MRCKVENAGYPGLANNTNTGLLSYNITLTDPRLLAELTITKESIGKDEDDEDLTDFDMTMQIGGRPIPISRSTGAMASAKIIPLPPLRLSR